MAKKDKFNYAGPGAIVGVQGGSVVITGSLKVGKDGIQAGSITTDDNDDEDD